MLYCDRIWDKGPYPAKSKLMLRGDTPVRVNPVKKVFFLSTLFEEFFTCLWDFSVSFVEFPHSKAKANYKSTNVRKIGN